MKESVADAGGDSTSTYNGSADGCTERCTGGLGERTSDATGTATVGNVGAAGERFAAALAMIATLPLTDDEKAEAVRRLLAVGTVTNSTTTKTFPHGHANAGFGDGVTEGKQ